MYLKRHFEYCDEEPHTLKRYFEYRDEENPHTIRLDPGFFIQGVFVWV